MENQPFENKPGSISIFANKTVKDTISHNFYGTLLSEEGEERKLQLYTRTSNEGKIYLIGNVATTTQMLNEMSSKIEKEQLNSIVLFKNETYIPKEDLEEGTNERPYYTGYYIDSLANKHKVSVWKKEGKISTVDFFSGKIGS